MITPSDTGEAGDDAITSLEAECECIIGHLTRMDSFGSPLATLQLMFHMFAQRIEPLARVINHVKDRPDTGTAFYATQKVFEWILEYRTRVDKEAGV